MNKVSNNPLAEFFRRSKDAIGILRQAKTATEPATLVAPTINNEMPQAEITDPTVKEITSIDLRRYFSDKLTGTGLEIGPLHRPLPTHPGLKMVYIDRYTVDQLRQHYPELKDLPLVEPDIIGDGETLSTVKSGSYDCLVSAHVIEHMKNPLGSLERWCRVLKPGGKIYLIVPDKRAIFDHHRVRTTLEHIILDYKRPSAERDFEHCLDYAKFVHGKSGNEALIFADHIIKTNYSIHYHVFIPEDTVKLVEWFSTNVRHLSIIEGPVMTPKSDEFHLLLQLKK